MNYLRPLLLLFLITTLLALNACQKNPSEECQQEIINDPNYFSVNRTLTNGCSKQQGIDYILTGNNTYVISANTFIEAGTIIEVEDSAALIIETTGILQAIGTATAPIIIRGHHRSTGHWKGLFVRSSSALNQLYNVSVEDGGGASIAGETARGAIVLLDQGKIAVNASTITGSASYGINVASLTAGLSELKNSTLTNNNSPLFLHTTQADPIATATNNLKGNRNDYVAFGIVPFINETHIWPTLNVPYRLMSLDSGNTTTQSLSGAANLTIEPGNVLEMSPETGFSVRDISQLSVIGTAGAPIVFTGTIKDYSTWKGFEFRFTQEDNRFEKIRIEHAGSQDGVIYMWGDPKLTFDEVEFTYSTNCVFYDAPKTSAQSINNNLLFRNILYNFVNAQYCKGN
ncbi:MAG: hypothetical protein ACRBFS_20385 [Aureispira sp.]